MTTDLRQGFRLGDREVFPKEGRIIGPNGTAQVEPKFMEVLLCLAENAGEVIDRDTLIQTVWGHAAVTDDSVNQSISQLRGYLGDDRHSPKYVETVPKLGYRLIASVEPLFADVASSVPTGDSHDTAIDSDSSTIPVSDEQAPKSLARQFGIGIVAGIVAAVIVVLVIQPFSPEQSPNLLSSFAPPENTIAVMPFTDLSDGGDKTYFSEGLAEDLQLALARVDGLTVVARSSSFAFRNRDDDARSIGQKLNVRALLEGSVRLAGDEIRVTTRLIDTRDGYQIWAESYDREFSGVFNVQEEIARAVVQALELELVGAPDKALYAAPTPSFDAYNLYLLGRFYWHKRTPEALALAAEYFEQATNLDPEFALAYSGIVDSYVFLTLYGDMSVDDATTYAEPALVKALKYGDDLAEVHGSHGIYLTNLKGNQEAALQAHQRSRDLNPNYPAALRWWAIGYADNGQFTRAIELLTQATRIDPLNQSIRSTHFSVLMKMGRYEEAMVAFRTAPWLDEPDASTLRTVATWTGAYGRPDEGLVLAHQALEKDPNGPITLVGLVQLYLQLGDLNAVEKNLLRAQQIAPDNLSVFVWRAKANAANNKFIDLMTHTRRHLETTETAMANQPNYAYIWGLYNLGVAALLNDDFELASEKLALAIALHEDGILLTTVAINIEMRTYLACAYEKSGQFEKAAVTRAETWQQIDKAKTDGWGHPQFLHTIAGLYALDGQGDEAMRLLAQTLSNGPTSGRRGSWKGFWSMEFDPTLDSLRDRSDYLQLIESVNAQVANMRENVEKQNKLAATR